MRVLEAIFVILILCTAVSTYSSTEDAIYGYVCQSGICVKEELIERNWDTAISLPVCRLFCGDSIGTLWPKPTGLVHVEPFVLHIKPTDIDFQFPTSVQQEPLWKANKLRFLEIIKKKILHTDADKSNEGRLLRVLIKINESSVKNDREQLTLDTDESYVLSTNIVDNSVILANITANSFFGARHGLETLLQLIVYDDIRHELQVVAKCEIHDAPVYKWRGLVLDTARNFYSVKSIKRTLDTMAMTKLNTFHWHITDSQSFPIEIKSQPDLHRLGAFSQRKVYSHEDIRDIVEYGRVRGIRVMPEFDAPAHVGEGWQHKNMTACFNAQPWSQYCVEPPCGQLDPTVDQLYEVLEDIYQEMFQLFDPDVFHMGGDEVSVNCWNSSNQIVEWMLSQKWNLKEADFMQLWGRFQTLALERVDKIDPTIPIILWTSRLTDMPFIQNYLNNKRYIIQIWSRSGDQKTKEILELGYPVILSNYDALYFDCGGPGWVGDGQNWCSPYIGWQKVYDYKLSDMAGAYNHLVLGAEAAVWSEQIDEHTLEARLWPRASALAERLWSDPKEPWRYAESRMLIHRQTLVDYEVGAEALQPEWCLQNEENCPRSSVKNFR